MKKETGVLFRGIFHINGDGNRGSSWMNGSKQEDLSRLTVSWGDLFREIKGEKENLFQEINSQREISSEK
jgi:hypothetical protein